MLSIPRFSSSPGSTKDSLGEALLNWGFLRTGLNRARSVEKLPDQLRSDVGLPPREKASSNPRDWSW
jgi:hypothetical protein